MNRDDWEAVLDELLEVESGLSGWEIDFLESLDGRRTSSCRFGNG